MDVHLRRSGNTRRSLHPSAGGHFNRRLAGFAISADLWNHEQRSNKLDTEPRRRRFHRNQFLDTEFEKLSLKINEINPENIDSSLRNQAKFAFYIQFNFRSMFGGWGRLAGLRRARFLPGGVKILPVCAYMGQPEL